MFALLASTCNCPSSRSPTLPTSYLDMNNLTDLNFVTCLAPPKKPTESSDRWTQGPSSFQIYGSLADKQRWAAQWGNS